MIRLLQFTILWGRSIPWLFGSAYNPPDDKADPITYSFWCPQGLVQCLAHSRSLAHAGWIHLELTLGLANSRDFLETLTLFGRGNL